MSQEIIAQTVLYEHYIMLKSCTRCAGDRQVRSDIDGFYIACLCGGHVTDPVGETSETVRLLEWKYAS